MKRNDKIYKRTILIDVPEIENEVEICGLIKMVDDGIGSYECHGYKGFDSRIEPEVQDVIYDVKKYTVEDNKIISKYLDENSEKLDEQLLDGFEPDEEPEREYEPEI